MEEGEERKEGGKEGKKERRKGGKIYAGQVAKEPDYKGQGH